MKRVLAGIALLLGIGAALAGTASAPTTITATELAREIRARTPGLIVLDARAPAAFEADSIPTAVNVAPAVAGSAVILYADSTAEAVRAASRPDGGRSGVRVLAGGFGAWSTEVLRPKLPDDPHRWTPADKERAELSAYFGGSPRDSSDPDTPVGPFARRRGC